MYNCQYTVHQVISWLSWFMVFNATFNNFSVISWCSVLLLEELEKTTDLSQVTDNACYVWFMVFNTTFNIISVILWWSVSLVEET